MNSVKTVSCNVRELLTMITVEMGYPASGLYLRFHTKKKIPLGKKIMMPESFMNVRVSNYRRLGDPRMGYWEADIDLGYKNKTRLIISMTSMRIGKSAAELVSVLMPRFSTITPADKKDKQKPPVDLEAVA